MKITKLKAKQRDAIRKHARLSDGVGQGTQYLLEVDEKWALIQASMVKLLQKSGTTITLVFTGLLLVKCDKSPNFEATLYLRDEDISSVLKELELND